VIDDFLKHDRSTLEASARRMCLATRLADDRLICRVLGKYIMYVDAQDRGITPHLALNGYWEAWVTLAIARLLQPDWCCVDIGANVGYFTMIMADAVGPQGKILAVEPHPAACELLELSLEVNGFSRFCGVARVAVTDEDGGRTRLSVVPGRGLLATVLPDLADPNGKTLEVATATVDTLTRDWPRVDFVKVDVEGAEDLVWSGMARTLDRNPHITVVLEFTPSRYRNPARFISSIRSSGFALRYVREDGTLGDVSAEDLSRGGSDERWWMLYLARH
jgi:FkbM family methyltransferase